MLDTNVWLDLLVFRDPAVEPLLRALQAGEAIVPIAPAMLDELARVLTYPTLSLEAAARDGMLREASELSRLWNVSVPRASLRCRDPDDQMFVDLALAARVDALLSRDECVLRLASRLRREGVEVATPAAWCAARVAQISKR